LEKRIVIGVDIHVRQRLALELRSSGRMVPGWRVRTPTSNIPWRQRVHILCALFSNYRPLVAAWRRDESQTALIVADVPARPSRRESGRAQHSNNFGLVVTREAEPPAQASII